MNNKTCLHQQFSQPLLDWFAKHGRKNLPWQNPRSPYAVWVSEIMLQQTQVQTVIPYFLKFMTHFPTLETLALAHEDQVLALWAGLGYYSRARNLHKTAQIILKNYQGIFPDSVQILNTLPGIGESTAAAITSQAFGKPEAILDANVKRILARYFQVEGLTDQTDVKKYLWELARNCMPDDNSANYTQAIMDLGALVCKPTHPQCEACPLKSHCLSNQHQITHLYPAKKQKKTLPVKEQFFLVLHDDNNHIYLEKRPAPGIWGGLWCLPAVENNAGLLEHIEENYGFSNQTIWPFMRFKHTFTHFHLNIQVLSLSIQSTISRDQWFSEDHIQTLGLPKPIQKILSVWFEE